MTTVGQGSILARAANRTPAKSPVSIPSSCDARRGAKVRKKVCKGEGSCRAGVAHAVDQRFELTLRLGLGLAGGLTHAAPSRISHRLASELTAANLVKDGLQ